MALYQEWQAYSEKAGRNRQKAQIFWTDFFQKEKDIYAQLLDTDGPVSGTVEELAERYGVTTLEMAGFLDGINDSLKEPNPLETMEADTVVSLDYDTERLYKNMVAATAEWLYELPQWDRHLSEERRKELYREQKDSTTIRKPKKVGRNDPCPCGSGKKYKYCCGR